MAASPFVKEFLRSRGHHPFPQLIFIAIERSDDELE